MKTMNAALNRCAYCVKSSSKWRTVIKYFSIALMFTAGLFGAISIQAQTVQIKAGQQIVTVPLNYNGTVIITNLFTIGTNGVVPDSTGTNFPVGAINLGVGGIPSTPAGLTFNITDPNSNALSVIAGKANTSGFKTNVWLAINVASVPEGVYTFGFNATGGATNTLLYTLQVGYIWNGSTNAVANGAGSWTDLSQWLGGGVPGPNDDVIFSQLGAQTNSIASITTNVISGVSTNITTNYIVNCAINSNVTIGSMRFSQTNSVSKYHTISLGSGNTLTLTGTNGFSFLRDYINSIAGLSSGMNVAFLGTNSSIVISNSSANFSLLNDNQIAYGLDLSQVGGLQATVSRFAPADYSTYPNFWNLDANGYAGNPMKFTAAVSLAQTNFITASFVDPYNYTNPYSRLYAINIWNTAYGSGDSQAGQTLLLGATNVFYADAVNLCGYGHSSGVIKFNPAFTSNNPVAIFRGTSGGRMSIFSILDCAGTNIANGNSKAAGIDFGSSHGMADILADQFLVARDRPAIVGTSSATYQGGTVDFGGNSIVNVNWAVIGDQDAGGHSNTVDFAGYCNATLVVSNNAVFQVNRTLALGYTTETNNAFADEHNGYGKIIIGPGGTVMASNITVGGITKFSTGNTITINSNATLIVSNTIADTVSALGTLTLGGKGTLELFLDGNHSGSYVYVTNLTTATAMGANTIQIGGVTNLNYNAGSAQVPLISYAPGQSPTVPGVVMPPGLFGSIIVINGDEWDLVVTTNLASSKNLLWRAAGSSGNWDTASYNWLDKNTGLMTNFSTGDQVTFDDTPGYATTVNMASPIIIPSMITVTNSALYYTFTGSGLEGSASLNKIGSGTLEIDGSALVAILVTQGLLTNSPSAVVGSVSVSTGASLANSGTINGSITSGGNVAVYQNANVNGALTIQNGGAMTNMGNINMYGVFSLQSGSYLYNSPAGILDNFSGTTATNSVLYNDGLLGNSYAYANTLTVGGILEDSGVGSLTMTTLTISSGGLFIPGGNGIGATIMYHPPSNTGFPGAIMYSTGSTNVFKVDFDNSQYTKVLADYESFGGSSSQQTQTGATLVITNVGATPFAAGQSFQLFQNTVSANIKSTGTSTNTFPIISPTVPGPGLAWDLTHLWVPNTSGQNGVIGVINANSGPTLTNAFSVLNKTNMIATFSWPSSYYGWRLQTQANPLTVGLSTNWTGVNGSWTNLSMTITNSITNAASAAVFYRLVFP